MVAGRRIGGGLALLATLSCSAVAAAQTSGVGTAARGGQRTVALDGRLTAARAQDALDRVLRGHGYRRLHTVCSGAGDGRARCEVCARDGGVTWTGTAQVRERGSQAVVRYALEGQ